MAINYTKYWIIGLVLSVVLVFAGFQQFAKATLTSAIPTQAPFTFVPITFFSATTTGTEALQTATSTKYLIVAGAKKLTFYFTHGGTATTSTATSSFTVQVSADPSNASGWLDYPRLLTGTSSTLVNKVDIAGATSTVWAALNGFATESFYAVRCVVTGGGQVGTQGEHTCKATAEY